MRIKTLRRPVLVFLWFHLMGSGPRAEALEDQKSDGLQAVSDPAVSGTEGSRIETTVPGPVAAPIFLRLRFYSDWSGARSGGEFRNIFSNRLKLQAGQMPGNGWTVHLDLRNRYKPHEVSPSLLYIYDARVTYDDQETRLYFSGGKMNLYDTAGIGQLMGAAGGYKPTGNLLVGGYGGLQPEPYTASLDTEFLKYGAFLRYLGHRGRSLAVSLNELRYSSETERRFVYVSGLTPLQRWGSVYGNLEYEIAPNIRTGDRLSRAFFNGRFDPADQFDFTLHYSSGKGLDYHRYLLERLDNPGLVDPQLERLYYSTQYGIRLRYKPTRNFRVFVGQRVSERKDQNIRNRTTQLGLSAADIGGSGLNAFAHFNLNRGDRSESDSLYLSVSRSFGRVSWTAYYSNMLNSLRWDYASGVPEIVHLDNQHTVTNNFFFVINRYLAVSFDYERTFGGHMGDLFFARLILRM